MLQAIGLSKIAFIGEGMSKKHQRDNRVLDVNKLRLICTLLKVKKNSQRKIAEQAGSSQPTVHKIYKALRNLSIEQRNNLESISNSELLVLLYPELGNTQPAQQNGVVKNNKYVPNFDNLAAEMVEKRISKQEVYEEYIKKVKELNVEPFTLSYVYRKLEESLKKINDENPDYYFIQNFNYGEQMQADFTGDKYKLKTHNGEVECWILVLTFPASYYCYAGFVTAQSTMESCRVISDAIRYFGNRVPQIIVSDNAKCFVTSHQGSQYVLNRSFENFIADLGICFLPTPVRKPQDKSSVEYSVRLIQNCLKKNHISFDTADTIAGHSACLQRIVERFINQAPFRKDVIKTREFLFNNYERSCLKQISFIPEYMHECKTLIVPRSYHITVEEHRYSVPYQYIKKLVDVFLLDDHVLIKYQGKVIAKHLRNDSKGTTTVLDHMPKEHQEITKANEILKTPTEILEHASMLGEEVYGFCRARLDLVATHPQTYLSNALTSCRAVIRFYETEEYKELVLEAFKMVLQLPTDQWRVSEIKKIYLSLVKQYKKDLKNSEGTSLTTVNRTTSSNSYLRNTNTTEVMIARD